MIRTTVRISLTLFVCLAVPFGPAEASSAGITGASGQTGSICTVCHFGGLVPISTFSGPTSVTPGSTHTYTLTMDLPPATPQRWGGLDVSVNAGGLIVTDVVNTQLLLGEVTHTPILRSTNAAGDIVWTFDWQAPAAPGVVTMWGATNGVNGNGGPSGDNASGTTLAINVAGAATTPGETSGQTLNPLIVHAINLATGELRLTYDPACDVNDNNIYFGPLSDVDTYGYSGEDCGIGNTGFYDSFNPGTGSFFFVVVGNDGGTVEGSYGLDRDLTGASNERPDYPAAACGQAQNLSNTCP